LVEKEERWRGIRGRIEEEDVVWLDVEVEDALGVAEGQGGRHLAED